MKPVCNGLLRIGSVLPVFRRARTPASLLHNAEKEKIMLWDKNHTSNDVDDRRAQGASRASAGMGIFGLLPFFARFGWKGILVFGAIAGGIYMFGGTSGITSLTPQENVSSPQETESVHFVSFVFDDTQEMWARTFPGQFRKAGMVVFRGATVSGCGTGESRMGPFYCPLDRKVYLDLSFYEELRSRFGAPGDFAQAYVIAHEMGHHIQNLMGTSDKVHKASAHAQEGADGLSVKLELQADCYAGVWAHDAQNRKILEVGDIDEAIAAAAAIGDDRIQKQGQGRVTPETWSHGSSAQRAQWLNRGMATGDLKQCNTFDQ